MTLTELTVSVISMFLGRVGVKVVSKKIRQAVGKANRRHQVNLSLLSLIVHY